MADSKYPIVKRSEHQLVTASLRQLSVTAALEQDQESARLKNLLRRNPVFMVEWLSQCYPLDEELLTKYRDRWNWSKLSSNKNLPWSLELIDNFENEWDWVELSFNDSLPWGQDLVDRFEERL